MSDTLILTRAEARDIERRRLRKVRQAEAKANRVKPPKQVRVKGQREPRQRDEAYLRYIRSLPCAVAFLGDCMGKTEAAHVRFSDAKAGKTNPGMQAKPDDRPWSVPLCHGHHNGGPQAQHAAGERAWWEAAGVDVLTLCRDLSGAYDTPDPRAAATAILLGATQ